MKTKMILQDLCFLLSGCCILIAMLTIFFGIHSHDGFLVCLSGGSLLVAIILTLIGTTIEP